MEEIVGIVRETGRQQGRNAYYRECYLLLKQLQDLVMWASNNLLQLYHCDDDLPPSSDHGLNRVAEIAAHLRNVIHDFNSKAGEAESKWEEFS